MSVARDSKALLKICATRSGDAAVAAISFNSRRSCRSTEPARARHSS